MNLPNSNIDLENNIFDTLTLSYNKLLNSATWLGANIAQLASYTTGYGTITLPTDFTHILIIMGGWGGGGGGSNGTGYGAWGGGAGAFIMAMRAKSELTWTSLSYSIWAGGSGGTAWNPWGNGSATTLTGSWVNLTAGQGYGGHRGTSVRGGNTGYGGTAITQLAKDIWINGWPWTNYNSGGTSSSTSAFFWICRWGMNWSESGMWNSGWGCAWVPIPYSIYQQFQHYLDGLDWTGCGWGGAYGGTSFRWGYWATWFLRIYYFYN